MAFRIPKETIFHLELYTQAKEGRIKIFSDMLQKFTSHVL